MLDVRKWRGANLHLVKTALLITLVLSWEDFLSVSAILLSTALGIRRHENQCISVYTSFKPGRCQSQSSCLHHWLFWVVYFRNHAWWMAVSRSDVLRTNLMLVSVAPQPSGKIRSCVRTCTCFVILQMWVTIFACVCECKPCVCLYVDWEHESLFRLIRTHRWSQQRQASCHCC